MNTYKAFGSINGVSKYSMQTRNPDALSFNDDDFQSLLDSMDALLLNYSDDTEIIDIHANVEDPLLLSPQIVDDLFKNLRLHEARRRPRIDYIEKVQQYIYPTTREYCVDRIAYVSSILRYNEDTLHLAVNYLDRYLSGNNVNPAAGMLILIGLSCLIVASKYEEVRDEFDFQVYVILSDGRFSTEDFVDMERRVVSFLQYDLSVPIARSFLYRFLRAAQAGQKVSNLGNYITELSLSRYNMLRFLPSLVAASSIFLARYSIAPLKSPWTATLQHYTLYQPSDLRDYVLALYDLYYNFDVPRMIPNTIRLKYSNKRYDYVSLKSPSPPIPPLLFDNIYYS